MRTQNFFPKVILALIVLSFLILFPNLYFEREGGIWAGNANLWADWAAHLTYARRFARFGPTNWFADNPVFAGVTFNYPYLGAMISGALLRLGLGEVWSLLLPTMVWVAGVVLLLFLFYRAQLKREGLAVFGVVLFFLGGGWAFIHYFEQAFRSGHALEFLLSTPPEYYAGPTDRGYFQFGGMLHTRFIPQRAMQLGILMGLLVLIGLHWAKDKNKSDWRLFVFLGVVFGLLPLVHVHTFISVGLTAGLWILTERKLWRRLLPFVFSAMFVSTAAFLQTHSESIRPGFLGFQLGWMATSKQVNFLLFWFLNWGIFLPIALASLRKKENRNNPFLWSGLALFILPNIIRFQPWEFDNTKIFAWSYLLLVPFVVEELVSYWRVSALSLKAFLVAGLVSLFLTGVIELRRLATPSKQEFQMYGRNARDLGETFSNWHLPGERILASDDPHHWVSALSGGQVIMGYRGWIFSYGLPWEQRLGEMRKMFAGGVEGIELLRRYKVRYVIIGPEKNDFEADESFFARRFKKVLERHGTRIYDVGTTVP